MLNTYFGYKLDQTQTFDDKGRRLVVTKIIAQPMEIIRIKTPKKDKYGAIIVNIKNSFKKKTLREIKITNIEEFKIGDKLTIDQVFKEEDKVMVSGITKGKGFAGVVKRWGFAGGPRTHGQSDRLRAPGSIGQGTDPGRVWKGKKMGGRMGGKGKTIKGLKILKINKEESELWIAGLVPGAKKGLLKISK